MKRTHKKMLGFAGLGLVAVATAVAAVLPTPLASAANITDTITVQVTTGQPSITFSDTSGNVVSKPNYSFKVNYTGLENLGVKLYRTTKDGTKTDTEATLVNINDPLTSESGVWEGNINLDDYGGSGYFEIVAEGKDKDGAQVPGSSLKITYNETTDGGNTDGEVDTNIPKAEVKYLMISVYDRDRTTIRSECPLEPGFRIDSSAFDGNVVSFNIDDYCHPDLPGPNVYSLKIVAYDADDDIISTNWMDFAIDGSGSGREITIIIGVHVDIDVVTTLETAIYDENGNLVRNVVIDRATGNAKVYDKNGNFLFDASGVYVNGKLKFIMDGLEHGIYKAHLRFFNANHKQIGGTIIYTIDYTSGTPIIVPDTGSFFQGLNISREDYLITGIVVFAIIGVVGFGIVKKAHGTKRIGGRNRR
ncbi:MAG: hypothetical protein Q4A36_02685 [Candidatus Saccharibacteria bacterium]|nr:hypothetical protein [Candidatus Saccharibacteria bacterium]